MTCRNLIRCLSVVILVASAFASVNVSSPAIGQGIVGSPVHYAATASTTCSKGIASMGVYVDSKLVFVVNGKSLATDISIAPGSHNTVVEEWDYCGGATYTKVPITVSTQSGVWVTSPVDGGVNSPVNYVATSTTSCSKGIASMGIYVNNKLNYTVQGSKLNTSVTLSPGKYDTVVQEWDHCRWQHLQACSHNRQRKWKYLHQPAGQWWNGQGMANFRRNMTYARIAGLALPGR